MGSLGGSGQSFKFDEDGDTIGDEYRGKTNCLSLTWDGGINSGKTPSTITYAESSISWKLKDIRKTAGGPSTLEFEVENTSHKFVSGYDEPASPQKKPWFETLHQGCIVLGEGMDQYDEIMETLTKKLWALGWVYDAKAAQDQYSGKIGATGLSFNLTGFLDDLSNEDMEDKRVSCADATLAFNMFGAAFGLDPMVLWSTPATTEAFGYVNCIQPAGLVDAEEDPIWANNPLYKKTHNNTGDPMVGEDDTWSDRTRWGSHVFPCDKDGNIYEPLFKVDKDSNPDVGESDGSSGITETWIFKLDWDDGDVNYEGRVSDVNSGDIIVPVDPIQVTTIGVS